MPVGVAWRCDLEAGDIASGIFRSLTRVQRAHDATSTTVQYVRVNHRRGNIRVVEQFLDRADVVSLFEKMGRE